MKKAAGNMLIYLFNAHLKKWRPRLEKAVPDLVSKRAEVDIHDFISFLM